MPQKEFGASAFLIMKPCVSSYFILPLVYMKQLQLLTIELLGR
jgi:hypothetical protein